MGKQGTQDDRSLASNGDVAEPDMDNRLLTVDFNHERFHDIVTNELEIRVSDPVTDCRLRTGEEVIDDSHLVPKEHQAVNEVRANETSSTSDENALAL